MGKIIGIPDNIEDLKTYLTRNRIIDKNGCWIHPHKHRRGYAQVRYKESTYNASRLSAHIYHNLDLDDKSKEACHKDICRSKACWNPEHICVGSHYDNMQDAIKAGNHFSLENKNKTHCDNGHEFTSKNTYIRPNGNRTCKECNKLAQRARRAS